MEQRTGNKICLDSFCKCARQKLDIHLVFHCFTVHFNSLDLTYQLMHFYIQ